MLLDVEGELEQGGGGERLARLPAAGDELMELDVREQALWRWSDNLG
jgi:hypothetical protein